MNVNKLHISYGEHRAWRSHEGMGDGFSVDVGRGMADSYRGNFSYSKTQYENEKVHSIVLGIVGSDPDDNLNIGVRVGLGVHSSETDDWGAGIQVGVGLARGMHNRALGFILMPTVYTWLGQYNNEWELRTEGALRFDCYYFF